MIKKRSFLLVAICICLFVCGCALCACGGPTVPANHTHKYNDREVITPATCTSPGKAKLKCSCGDEKEVEIPMTDHALTETIVTPATCETAGKKHLECSNCDYQADEDIKALGHNKVTKITKKATCLAAGESSNVCERCGTVFETRELPQLDHEYELIETYEPATCENAGSGREKCVNGCENERDTVIEPLGHLLASTPTVTKESTTEERGSQYYPCLRDGCDYRKVEELPRLPIQYVVKFRSKVDDVDEAMFTYKQFPTVIFKDENGEEVGRAVAQGDKDEYVNYDVALIELPAETYTLEVENLCPGYTLEQEEYTITRQQPNLTIYCNVEIIPKNSEIKPKYGWSAVVKDMDLTALGATEEDDEVFSLKTLIESNKAVYIAVGSTSNTLSMNEITYIAQTYNQKHEDVGIFMLLDDEIETAREFISNPGKYTKTYSAKIPFPVVVNEELLSYFKFDSSLKLPMTCVINCDGVICSIWYGSGRTSEFVISQIDSIALRYYNRRHPDEVPPETPEVPEAILSDRKFFIG